MAFAAQVDLYDCRLRYSLWNCSDCKAAYALWVCAKMFPLCNANGTGELPVCRSVCFDGAFRPFLRPLYQFLVSRAYLLDFLVPCVPPLISVYPCSCAQVPAVRHVHMSADRLGLCRPARAVQRAQSAQRRLVSHTLTVAGACRICCNSRRSVGVVWLCALGCAKRSPEIATDHSRGSERRTRHW